MQGVLDHCQEMESFLFLSLLLIISELMFSRLFDVLLATYILHTNTALDWVYIICVMSVKITKVAFYSCCMMIRWWKDRQYWLLRLIWWGQMHFHLWYYLVRCCWPIWENTEDDDEVTLSKNFKLHVNEIFFCCPLAREVKWDECFLNRCAECPVWWYFAFESHLATEKDSKACLFWRTRL